MRLESSSASICPTVQPPTHHSTSQYFVKEVMHLTLGSTRAGRSRAAAPFSPPVSARALPAAGEHSEHIGRAGMAVSRDVVDTHSDVTAGTTVEVGEWAGSGDSGAGRSCWLPSVS